jgi:hypothetical protein
LHDRQITIRWDYDTIDRDAGKTEHGSATLRAAL